MGKQLGSITAAIVNENQAAEKDLKLLARVEVQPNEMVEFYEPAPGRIVVSGAGAPQGSLRPFLMSRDLVELWRRIAGDAPVPAALREAIDRSERRQGVQRQDKTPRPETAKRRSRWGGGSPSRDFTRAGGYCDTGFYEGGWDACPDFYNYRVCVTNWMNGIYAYNHEAFNTWTQVCPATGAVAFRISSNEFGGGLWTVAQNNVRYWTYADPACSSPFDDCPYIRADVQQASGVRFHFQFMVEEE